MYTYSKSCIKYSMKENNMRKDEGNNLNTKENKVKKDTFNFNKIDKKGIFNMENKCYEDDYCYDNYPRKTIYQGKIKIKDIYNGNNIGYKEEFLFGCSIKQVTSTMFHLRENHIFLVTFNTNANLLSQGFISVMPRIDGIEKDEFSAKSANNVNTKNINTTSSFLINTFCEDLYVDFLLYSSQFKVNVLGSISIVEIS